MKLVFVIKLEQASGGTELFCALLRGAYRGHPIGRWQTAFRLPASPTVQADVPNDR